MPKVPLGFVISSILCITVIVVAAVTLSLSSVGALASVRSVGVTYAGELMRTAYLKTESFFDQSLRMIDLEQNASKSFGSMTPFDRSRIDGSTLLTGPKPWIYQARSLALNTIFLSKSDVFAGTYVYSDGSICTCFAGSTLPVTITCIYYDCGDYNYATGKCRGYLEMLDYNNRNGTGFIPIGPVSPFVTNPLWAYGTLLTSNWTLRGHYAQEVFVMRTGAISANETMYIFSLPLNGVVHNSSGHNTGMIVTQIQLTRINDFLRELNATRNTVAFAVDHAGHLLGSSHPTEEFYTFIEYQGANNTPPSAPGCSDSRTFSPTENVSRQYCRKHAVTSYPYRPLNVVAADQARMNETTARVTMEVIDGQRYYVASQKLRRSIKYFGLTLVVIMPEADVIGDITKSRNTSIGVTIAIIVVAAAIASFLVVWLLRPLSEISTRMYYAAAFNDTDETEMSSAVSEIHALQDAYSAMNKQLNRIKSFVPQSVLAACVDDDDAEAEAKLEDCRDDVGSKKTDGRSEGKEGERSTDKHSTAGEGKSVKSLNDETASQASTRSRKYLAAANAVAAVNAKVSLATQTVSVLVLNLRQFHDRIGELPVDGLVERYARLVAIVEREVNAHRGVVDSFHGDRFFISFNAVKPCANHAQRAASCALRIAADLPGVQLGAAMTAGLATGRAQVGNLGSNTLKRFNTIGAVYPQAAALERLCKRYGSDVQLLTHDMAFADVEHATIAFVQVIDAVALPGPNAKPVRIAAVRARAQVKVAPSKKKEAPEAAVDDEWMYQLNEGQKANPFLGLNRVFAMHAAGKADAAAAALADATQLEGEDAVHAAAVETLKGLLAGRSTELGAYYYACVMPALPTPH